MNFLYLCFSLPVQSLWVPFVKRNSTFKVNNEIHKYLVSMPKKSENYAVANNANEQEQKKGNLLLLQNDVHVLYPAKYPEQGR